jgi:hypothetical protein
VITPEQTTEWHDIILSFEDPDVRNRVRISIEKLLCEMNLPVWYGRKYWVYSRWSDEAMQRDR